MAAGEVVACAEGGKAARAGVVYRELERTHARITEVVRSGMK
jgi:hypothetical protein